MKTKLNELTTHWSENVVDLWYQPNRRKAWLYQLVHQKPQIQAQTTQWPQEKRQRAGWPVLYTCLCQAIDIERSCLCMLWVLILVSLELFPQCGQFWVFILFVLIQNHKIDETQITQTYKLVLRLPLCATQISCL